MTPQELYQAGNLDEAIAAAVEEVKQRPTNTAARGLLSQLLCFAGDLERADKQLETIGKQQVEAMVSVAMIRQLIRGETARRDFYTEGRVPELLDDPPPYLRKHLEASIQIREGNPAEAARTLAAAEEERPHVGGTCDGQAFDDVRDLDDLTAPFLEVLTSNGKYYWIPFDRIETMEFRKPERPLDLLWRGVHMIVRGGPDGEVFIPCLYHGSHAEQDDQLRLGRSTDWRGDEGLPIRGLGQRILLIGEEDRPILQLNEITFNESHGQN